MQSWQTVSFFLNRSSSDALFASFCQFDCAYVRISPLPLDELKKRPLAINQIN